MAFLCCLLCQADPEKSKSSINDNDIERSARYMQSLKSKDSFIARAAIVELTQMGPAASGPLCEALRSEDLLIRQRAANALSHIGPCNADQVRALIHALSDPDVEVRRRAALALGRGKPGDGAVAALISALQDRDTTVRLSAAVALGDISPETSDERRRETFQIPSATREALRKILASEQQIDPTAKRRGPKP